MLDPFPGFFHLAANASHFSILAPVNRMIAQKINEDTGAACNIAFSKEELSGVR